MKNMLYWLPRILAIALICFFSIFALDVFTQPKWITALFIHLIPSFILIVLTIISWKHERLGGFLFLGVGLVIAVFFHSFSLAILPAIIGMVFLVSDNTMKMKH